MSALSGWDHYSHEKNKMPLWRPEPIWKGQNAIIVGGGSSLKDFDFTSLHGKPNTLGCNDALFLGNQVVSAVLFGDDRWWQTRKWTLEKFPGLKFAAVYAPITNVPWLFSIPRVPHGLPTDGNIGWNYSTGACAIHLALLLGAVRIFLLGYDLSAGARGDTHWHNRYHNRTKEETFKRFAKGFQDIATALPQVYPQAQVINVTDGASQLTCFPKIAVKELDSALSAPSLALGEVESKTSKQRSQRPARIAARAKPGHTP